METDANREPEWNTEIPEHAFLIIEGVQAHPLKESVINIGRRFENHIIIDDPRISRHHAQLRAIKGRFVIFDLHSTGGTFVNGQRTSQTVLYPGDLISLAGVTLLYAQDNPRPDVVETSPLGEPGSSPRSTVTMEKSTVDVKLGGSASPASAETGTPDRSEEISFTAYHAKEGKVDSWHTLLVYAHLLSVLEKVRQDARRFGQEIQTPKETIPIASSRIVRGTELTIIPACQGITFNPERITLKWMEDFHRVEFRFKADASLAGDAAKGYISIHAGPLIIGTLKFAMLFNESDSASPVDREEQAKMYSKDSIFISYSHEDTDFVLYFRNVLEATGYDVLIDLDDLRSGRIWNDALMRMIERADIFQLFWSSNSCQSKYCQQEWEHALKQNRPEGYIRPVYWQRPLPEPPAELNKFHFTYVELKMPTADAN